MDEVVKKIAAIGLPGIIFVITMATTGLGGAAAITKALYLLGPGGMIGGIVFLGIIGLVSDTLTKYGLTEFLKAVYVERLAKGESAVDLCKEIDYLFITNELKLVLKDHLSTITNQGNRIM